MKIERKAWLLLALLGCEAVEVKTSADFSSDERTPSVDGSDDESEASDEPEEESIDECDDHAGETICIEGTALVCDEDGNVSASETCSEPAICADDLGCVDCSFEIRFDTPTMPILRIRPQMTSDVLKS